MYGALLIVCKILADALTALSGIYGLLEEFKDEHHKITRAGKVALAGIVIGFMLSGGIAYLEARKSQQDDEDHRKELARQHSEDQAQIARLQNTVETGIQQILLTLGQPQIRQASPSGPYSFGLSWHPSATAGVVGYNIYRSSRSGGPYLKLNSAPLVTLSYEDQTVTLGSTYYYVTTAVSSTGVESTRSNEVRQTVPVSQ
ncbi:MAG: hypothetical protein LAO24_08175 [Acidobacteriia bacterium]|nr:hypothetical protein [Terriglobia bacterium]